MGLEPSRGVLVELVEQHELEWPRLARALLDQKAGATPTTNRLARSLRLWRSTTVI